MILMADLVLTAQLVILAYGIMVLGKAFKEKNLANKIAGFVLVIGTTIFFACTMCHTVKYHKHHKHGFHGCKGKHGCYRHHGMLCDEKYQAEERSEEKK